MSKQTKSYLIGILIITLIAIGGLFAFSSWQKQNTQEVVIRAATDTDEGAIDQVTQFNISKLAPFSFGEQYDITVQYIIVDKVTDGTTLFSEDYRTEITEDDTIAHFGCKPIKHEEIVVATDKNVTLTLQLISTPSNIYDENGDTFDNTKQQLIPIIKIEPASNQMEAR